MTRFTHTLRTPQDLADAKLLEPSRVLDLARVAGRYAVAITPAMAKLVNPGDPADPIARQFIPDIRELDWLPQELADPIGDGAKSPVKGLVHRYRDRVLLKIVGICPVYCRFCFRREMVGPDAGHTLSGAEIEAALAYIRAHPQIWEVILTGGDPLMLSPRRASDITQALSDIPHVKVLRWHTRVPVVAPERVTADLITAMDSSSKTVYVAIHCNHPRELTGAARTALSRFTSAGIPLLSQSVLLKGINDNADTLEALMRAFVEAGVKPYYLHHADLAPGTSHLRTTIAEGQELMRSLRQRLSGIALPTYVLDIPGAHGKVPISSTTVSPSPEGGYLITDPAGVIHAYRETHR